MPNGEGSGVLESQTEDEKIRAKTKLTNICSTIVKKCKLNSELGVELRRTRSTSQKFTPAMRYCVVLTLQL